MGFIDTFAKIANPIGSAISAIGGAASTALTNAQNLKMQRESQKWQTSEREASQEYNTSERLGSQEFQDQQRQAQNQYAEDIYNQYQSPLAMVEQYKAAGLNPRLAMENGSGGSISASSGSSGGAPSGSHVSPGSVAPPYMQAQGYTQAFSTIADSLKSLGEAKKLGMETKYYEEQITESIKGMKLDNLSKELYYEVDKKYLDKKEASLLQESLQRLAKGDLDVKQASEILNKLRFEGLITRKTYETFDERFKAEINKINSEANLNDEKAITEKTQQTLNGFIAETEKTKPALNRSLTKLNGYLAESARVASEIANATELSEVRAIRDRNKNVLNQIEAEIKALNAQAELALKNGDYALWDKINGSVAALGSTGMLFAIGKNLFKKVAPALSAPSGSFGPQFKNVADLNSYGEGSEIWY